MGGVQGQGHEGRARGVSVQSLGEMGKDFCPNVHQPSLENVDRRSCNDGSRELSPSAVARTLGYFEAVPS